MDTSDKKQEVKARGGYPMLMESTASKLVVLFTSKGSGVVVRSDTPELGKIVGWPPLAIGESYNDWFMPMFIPFNGVLTLQNPEQRPLGPWEIVPKGWKLVTDEQRLEFKAPSKLLACAKSQLDDEFTENYDWTWDRTSCFSGKSDYVAFIVPEDYVFGRVELSMAQIAKLANISVEQLIIKKD